MSSIPLKKHVTLKILWYIVHNETIFSESLGFFTEVPGRKRKARSLMVCVFYFLLWLQIVQLYPDLLDTLSLYVRIYFIIGF